MTTLSLAMGVLVGLCVGSFLGCAAYRLPRNIPMGGERSFCPGCREPVKARFNIPVFGYLILKGRASCCGAKLTAGYILWEAATAVVFGVAGYLTNMIVVFGLACLIIFSVAVVDVMRRRRDG